MDCYASSYGTVLTQLGWDPVVLGDQWGFAPQPTTGAEWPILTLSIARRSYEEVLRFWYGIDVVKLSHLSTASSWAHIRNVLAEGWPVIVAVDSYHLPYSPHSGKMHLSHRLVLTGYHGETVDVLDGYAGWSFAGRLAITHLNAAMSALLEVPPGAQPLCTIAIQQRPASACYLDAHRTASVLADNAGRYLADRAVTRASVEPAGETLLRSAAAALRMPATAEPPPGVFLAGLVRFAELSGQRALNATFLRAAAAVLGNDRLVLCADMAQRSSADWLLIRNMLFLRAQALSRDVLKRIADRVCAIADLETQMSVIVQEELAAR